MIGVDAWPHLHLYLMVQAADRCVKHLHFCAFYGRGIAAFSQSQGTEYIYEECRLGAGSICIYHEELLGRMD